MGGNFPLEVIRNIGGGRVVGVKVRRLTKGGKITTGSKYRDIPHNLQGKLQLSLASSSSAMSEMIEPLEPQLISPRH